MGIQPNRTVGKVEWDLRRDSRRSATRLQISTVFHSSTLFFSLMSQSRSSSKKETTIALAPANTNAKSSSSTEIFTATFTPSISSFRLGFALLPLRAPHRKLANERASKDDSLRFQTDFICSVQIVIQDCTSLPTL